MFLLNSVIAAFVHIPAFVHIHNYLHNSMCMPSMMYLYHKYTYQDLCPWIICILTRTYVLGSCIYLPGPMSLDHMYTVLTRTYVLGSYVYCTYQDLCPWIICILYLPGPTSLDLPGLMSLDHMYTMYLPGPMSLDHMYTVLTRTYVLGSYVYLPGLMSLDHMYTYQDLRPWIICILTRTYVPWIICILTRTYVLGSYVYLPGLISLDHTYTYQDLGPWKKQQTNKHKTDSHTNKKKYGEKYVQTGRN